MIHLIGDIQGCDEALGRLLAEIGFSPSRDRIVCLGDLVNRGPQSAAVLRRLMAYGNSASCILGNHDLHLLAAAVGSRKPKPADTFVDVLQSPAVERQAMLEWLRQRPVAVQEAGWLCVHAGLAPQWSGEKALALAAEVQAGLRGPQCNHLLQHMYGNSPARWHEGLEGEERWRGLVNVFTRIRFCMADGTLDHDSKESAAAAPRHYYPWFAVPERASAGQPIAFGHWSTLGLKVQPDLLAIDTGCVWGGPLTAVRVDGGRSEVLQVPCVQSQKPGAA